jgi:hypothetical protein
MRTTIRLDEQLLAETKRLAAETGQTMTAVIEDALRQMLARQKQLAERPPVYLTTVHGKGLQPGVDLDDSAALLDLMEAPDDPA